MAASTRLTRLHHRRPAATGLLYMHVRPVRHLATPAPLLSPGVTFATSLDSTLLPLLARNAQRVRTFTSSLTRPSQRQSSSSSSSSKKESFFTRLRHAWNKTKIDWRPLPIGVGIGFLGAMQFYKIQRRDVPDSNEDHYRHIDSPTDDDSAYESGTGKPKPRPRTRPSGPWQVQVMSTLPLKAVSRLWGWFNEQPLPYYLRVPGFKLYAYLFGVNLKEVAEPDLHTYPNLASFFYRELKPGCRPLDPRADALVSPADGKVIQYGVVEHGEVEQVKGVTYSLDALLGRTAPSETRVKNSVPSSPATLEPTKRGRHRTGDSEIIKADEEFAQVNGISYTLPNLFSGPEHKRPRNNPTDQSTTSKARSESEVRADLALSEANKPWWSPFASSSTTPTALYYMVIYLAPGDYHRFHSPCSWVVTQRRHFAGELYSVSPYLQRTMPGLFTLNERVVLLGRWRWGFFSYTPVGATNVGSIRVNFDRELRTNSLTTDTEADRQAEAAAERGEPYSGFSAATYEAASSLGGHALSRGEEMGGFQLGSTIVLVFEAPKGRRRSFDEGFVDGETPRKGGWKWSVTKGQRVQVGQALGYVEEDE